MSLELRGCKHLSSSNLRQEEPNFRLPTSAESPHVIHRYSRSPTQTTVKAFDQCISSSETTPTTPRRRLSFYLSDRLAIHTRINATSLTCNAWLRRVPVPHSLFTPTAPCLRVLTVACSKRWDTLRSGKTFVDLKDAVKNSEDKNVCEDGLRSICWKVQRIYDAGRMTADYAQQAFLLYGNPDQATWLKQLAESRSAYISLRQHFLRFIEHPDDLESSVDPLSEDAEVSRFQIQPSLDAENLTR